MALECEGVGESGRAARRGRARERARWQGKMEETGSERGQSVRGGSKEFDGREGSLGVG